MAPVRRVHLNSTTRFLHEETSLWQGARGRPLARRVGCRVNYPERVRACCVRLEIAGAVAVYIAIRSLS